MIFGVSHIVYASDYSSFENLNKIILINGYKEYFRQDKISNSDVIELIDNKKNLTSGMVFYKKESNPSIEIVLYDKISFEKSAFDLYFDVDGRTLLNYNDNNLNDFVNICKLLGFGNYDGEKLEFSINSPAPTMNLKIMGHNDNHNNLSFGYLDNYGVNCFSLLVSKIEDKYRMINEIKNADIVLTELFEKSINEKVLKVFFLKSLISGIIIEFIEYRKDDKLCK